VTQHIAASELRCYRERTGGNMNAKLSIAALLTAAACGAQHDLQTCQERSATIETGVFGCTTSTNDVGDVTTQVLPNFEVQIFVEMPPPTPDDGLTPARKTRSDESGFYQIELSPGIYWICTTFRRCGELTIPAGKPVEKDYDFGPGPGW
jgi:hypothetical protein